ncbi:MAG: amidohydrolase family protein, partial [Steroidobacteraceae bacterium]
ARERSRSPEETIVDLVLEDGSRVIVAYFLMSEDNVRRQLALPWVSLCSDEEALAPRGVFLAQHPHPRAYGAFARFLGRYVRDEKVITLPEAIRRLTSLPAKNFRLRERGRIAPGCCGDVVVFDPRTLADHATYDEPQRFASGVAHVLVNGQIVLRDGEMTGARPGRFVRGPGRAPARQDAPIMPKAAG